MTSHYREALQALRCDVGLIRDHCYNAASRAITTRMLALINAEIERLPREAVADPALVAIPSAVLLQEISRRMREIRHTAKICTRCNVRRHRARGLCHKCYKIALKRGYLKARRQDRKESDGLSGLGRIAKAPPALTSEGFKYGSIGGRRRAKAGR